MEKLYDGEAAEAWLRERGIARSSKTLRKLRCIGGGPRFRRLGRRCYYTEDDLAEWIEAQLSPPAGSTAEADGLAESARVRQ
jgi:hypothetical protein